MSINDQILVTTKRLIVYPLAMSELKLIVKSLKIYSEINQLNFQNFKFDKNAIRFHVPMAKTAGASRDELKEIILLSITINMLKWISNYLPEALKIYEKS